jgi:hypothetical protein
MRISIPMHTVVGTEQIFLNNPDWFPPEQEGDTWIYQHMRYVAPPILK